MRLQKPDEFLTQLDRTVINSWLDRLHFPHILLVWLFVIIGFGVIYFLISTPSSYLYSNPTHEKVTSLWDAIYFSFVSATTVGFGDIIPLGSFRLVSIIEVVFGFLLLAVVTSKLVSIKQDVILGELYEISFDERVNQIRSNLLLFRQNLDRLMAKIEEKNFQRRQIEGIHHYISALEDVLGEVRTLVTKQGHYHFIKHIDPVNAELIFNSIISSFERLGELLAIMSKKKVAWKTEVNMLILQKCLEVNESLFTQVHASSLFTHEVANDLNAQKNKAVAEMRKAVFRNVPSEPPLVKEV